MKRAFILIFLCFGGSFVVFSQDKMTREQYIETYKELAIAEMFRAGVPASITMAQGILESNNGNSRLAKEGNNHFGIKCGDNWSGAAYYKKDDDYSQSGYLEESCFRSYPTVEASFADHSSLIASPQKAYRYGPLFELPPTDYTGWARGLQQAGYATSTTYAAQLISLIGRYELSDFDQPAYVATEKPTGITPPLILTTNKVPFTLASGYETARDISNRTGVPLTDLLVYNEDLPTGYLIPEGQKVFLSGKKKAFRGPVDTHQVQPSETMYDISQRYGIRLEDLLKRNRMDPGEQPAVSETIKLRGGKVKEPPRLKPETAPGVMFHTVEKGDTLWNISQRYQTTVETLRQLNGLSSNLIRLGMELRVR